LHAASVDSVANTRLGDSADGYPSQLTSLNTSIKNTTITNANGRNILTLDVLLSRIMALFASISEGVS
jgi:hypothetical protein